MVWLSAGLTLPPDWRLATGLGLGWALACLGAIDLASFRLPDRLTLPLTAAGLAVSLALPGGPVLDHLAGAVVGWSLLAAVSRLFRYLRGVEGLGLGDAKLLGAGGAWLGWQALPSVLMVGCLAAFAWLAVRVLLRGRRTLTDRLAFGVPLCAAIWLIWLAGPLTVPV